MLDKQFPETLATIYVIRAPYTFPTLFALVRPFLSTQVRPLSCRYRHTGEAP